MRSDRAPSSAEFGDLASPPLRVGTRGSALARWQTEHVIRRLQELWPGLPCHMVILRTRGDRQARTPLPRISGKGLFTAELEAALRAGSIHLAVHSLKDLPIEPSEGLMLAAVLAREDPRDVLISRGGYTLDALPPGASVGTSSPRRAAQLLARRPDLRIIDLRGNVDTRVRKALDPEGPYDAIVLARAGLARLSLLEHITQVLPLEVMLPAPGQGALAVQIRADDEATRARVQALDDPATRAAVTAERAFLAALGGGCAIPVAAYAALEGTQGPLTLRGRVLSPGGDQVIEVQGSAPPEEAVQLGETLARQALRQGADALLPAPGLRNRPGGAS